MRRVGAVNPFIPLVVAVMLLLLYAPSAFSQSQGGAAAVQSLPSFSQLVKQVAPAVVNISTETTVKPEENPFEQFFGKDERMREFFEKFFGEIPERALKRRALGSGFIIDKSGLILTNNHVVQKATDITVVTSDAKEYKAKLIGTDQRTDLALIRIQDADRAFPTLTLGDSDKMEVGDWVISIGNPLGLSHTVTQGIISAKARFLGLGPYDNFIQTDAPVNPGNSGGPLLNLRGEVIGVTTAMATAQAIAFAIPSNTAKQVSAQLREKGRVVRGFIGVSIQEVTRDLAKALGLKEPKGALVGDVVQGGPADKGGIRRGDVITAFAGKPIQTANDLPLIVAGTPVGRTVPVTIIREGKEMTLQVQVQELKEEKKTPKPEKASQPRGELGLEVADITPALQKRLDLKDTSGVVVMNVRSGSPADRAGIEEGDVILSVNRKQVSNTKEFKAAIDSAKKGERLLLLIRREGMSRFVTVERQ